MRVHQLPLGEQALVGTMRRERVGCWTAIGSLKDEEEEDGEGGRQ